MKSNKTLSIVIIIVNIIGFLCLIYFAIPYLTHDTFVYNPDAMLPTEVWDSAGMTLTIGFVPLLIANIFAFMYVLKDKIKKPLRLLFFIPSLICLGLVVSYWITSLI